MRDGQFMGSALMGLMQQCSLMARQIIPDIRVFFTKNPGTKTLDAALLD
jgi:hypothetical protein